MDGKYQKLLSIGVKESKRIAKLIGSMQDFNRPSSGVSEPVDVHESINEIIIFFRKKLQKKNIDLRLNYDEHLPKINLIPDQFKQVVLNMVQNAEEATDHKGSITITTYMAGLSVNIQISDTGCGIKPEIIKNIFDPFFTTKSAVKGTGLGLYICHGIIKAQGGDIKVESQPDEGTKMTLSFPSNEGTTL